MANSGNWQTETFGGMQYELLLPDGYSPTQTYPLLLFLHGGGEENGLIALTDPWFNTPDFRASYPAIVIEPILQSSSLTNNWGGYPQGSDANEAQALAITENVIAQYAVDPNRVYVTGLSLGGHGAWDLMIKDNAYDGTQGRVFAAALPLAGFESSSDYSTVSSDGSSTPLPAVVAELKGVPIWAVEGVQDYPEFDATMAADLPNSAYRYTQLPLGHDVWDTTYPLPDGKPYYDWLFSQSANLQTASTGSMTATLAAPVVPVQLAQEQAVARLYEAAFGRAADDAGLIANYNGTVSGVSLSQLGDSFVASPEFAARYGSPSNADFISKLYQNALGRAGDAAGMQDWETALQNGVTRGAVVAGFAQSPEAIAVSQSSAGIVYAATAEAQVARLYDAAFLRPPDAQGGAGFTAALLGGMSLQQAATTFITSPEFVGDYGAALSNLGFVDLIYNNALHRAPDAAGSAGFLQQLQTGQISRAAVFVAISESPEHIYLMANGR